MEAAAKLINLPSSNTAPKAPYLISMDESFNQFLCTYGHAYRPKKKALLGLPFCFFDFSPN